MKEESEESGFVGSDCREPMEERGKGLGLGGEEDTLEVLDSGVCDVNGVDEKLNGGGLATSEDGNADDSGSEDGSADDSGSEDNVEETVSSDDNDDDDNIESETERDDVESDEDAEVKLEDSETVRLVEAGNDETGMYEIKSESDDDEGEEEESVISGGNEVSDEEEDCEVEDNGGACDDEQNVETEEKADQEKESVMNSEEDNNKMDVDGKEADEENVGLETKDDKDSEFAQALEDAIQLSEEELSEENLGIVSEVSSPAELHHKEEKTNVDQKEENGEAMEIDLVAEEQVEKDVNEPKDSADIATDVTGKTESAEANPNSPREDSARGQVEPLDHSALFDPSSDITNFIDFSGVSSWSGNIQDIKTETGDEKPSDMIEEVTRVDCGETHKSVDATGNAIFHDKLGLSAVDHECLDKKAVDEQVAMREEDDITQEAPSIDPDQREDTEMEENRNNSDAASDGTDSDIKTNGVKRKADVLREDLLGEGRKTVSFAKVSIIPTPSFKIIPTPSFRIISTPSFKIGACIARAATQMAGSPSALKGGNVSDETLSVESFVSQLHCAATDPDKENVVSEIATSFFLDFRNSSASQQVTPEKVSNKRGRPSDCNAGGTEAYEFEEKGDTYWTDRVIHNGGEEQTPPTEKESYKIVPVELKPAPLKRTRRPYRKRQPQIIIPVPASNKPANYDENAPAELIMNFSETDIIPPEKSLSKMFKHFGPIRESQTEIDKEKNRARVVYRKGTDAEVAYSSAGRFSIFGSKAVKYELRYTVTEAFKVHPYVVSLGEENAVPCPSSQV